MHECIVEIHLIDFKDMQMLQMRNELMNGSLLPAFTLVERVSAVAQTLYELLVAGKWTDRCSSSGCPDAVRAYED